MSGNVGRIVFGPERSAKEVEEFRRNEAKQWTMMAFAIDGTRAHACNCIGPQNGERLCPCMLRAESEKGRAMVRDGVRINGIEYDLVPKRSQHHEGKK